jgi:hypothetical protein
MTLRVFEDWVYGYTDQLVLATARLRFFDEIPSVSEATSSDQRRVWDA